MFILHPLSPAEPSLARYSIILTVKMTVSNTTELSAKPASVAFGRRTTRISKGVELCEKNRYCFVK